MLFTGLLLACGQFSPDAKESEPRWWTEEDRNHILNELDRTTEALRLELRDISSEQWEFHESRERWSIGEIVEHLEMQNQLHYREISIVMNAPQPLHFRSITEGQDDHFTKYASDPTPGKARWFLEPIGRFCSKDAGENAFFRARGELRKLVASTHVDLRKQFTFRAPAISHTSSPLSLGEVRDLHQLLLTGVAHTDRHLKQIRNIKKDERFPK